jgi:hypothetical protein
VETRPVEGNRDPDSQPGSEEAAWRELIAQFDTPAGEPSAVAPWPSAEDMPADASDRMPGQDTMPDWELATRSGADADVGGLADFDQFGNVSARAADQSARGTGPSGNGWRTPQVDYDPDDADQYSPEALPPPQLDPVAKGAWAAVVGGPLYLLIGWLLGWEISGFGALLAVGATVSGFVILVLRLGDRPSRGDDDDHGAVL